MAASDTAAALRACADIRAAATTAGACRDECRCVCSRPRPRASQPPSPTYRPHTHPRPSTLARFAGKLSLILEVLQPPLPPHERRAWAGAVGASSGKGGWVGGWVCVGGGGSSAHHPPAHPATHAADLAEAAERAAVVARRCGGMGRLEAMALTAETRAQFGSGEGLGGEGWVVCAG